MKRILVIGGYGGFGARLCQRLAKAGHFMIVGGRSLDKAQALAGTIANAEAVIADRMDDLAPLLKRAQVDIVIDAAGPFQGSDYRVPLACIAAGAHYLDLADARHFVCDIATLDEAAKAAGVAIISGASTLPALSGAVARHLAAGLDRVESVDMALSAFNRSTAGASVARAILSYAGQPIRIWRNHLWEEATGWQEMQAVNFKAGDRQVRGRWVALSEVPDLDLMPLAFPDKPDVVFRAGNELRFQMLALWCMSWLVRVGLLKSLLSTAWLILPLQRAMLWMGSNRSAMHIAVSGTKGADRLERKWTIIAHSGDGPQIPTMAAELLANDIAAGKVPAGARDASALLDLERFDAPLAELDIAVEISERPIAPAQ